MWLSSWSDVARTVVTRRDHRIHLGITKRRTKKVTPPIAPVPSPTPADGELAPASRAA